MKIANEDEIFYFYSGNDITMSSTTKTQVYDIELKSNKKFNPVQLSIFLEKSKIINF